MALPASPRSLQLAALALAFAAAGVAWIAVLRQPPVVGERARAVDPAQPVVTIEHAPPPSVRARATEAAAAERPIPVPVVPADARLEVRVTVRTAWTRNSKLADLPIELVLAPPGRAFEVDPLQRVATDGESPAVFDVPWSVVETARAEHRGLRLQARVRASGWQRRAVEIDLPAAPEVRDVQLGLHAGGTVLGRLVDAQGQGVRGRIQVTGSPGAGAPWTSVQVESREDGAFAFDCSSPGLHDFLADAGEHGTAGLARHDIVLGEPPMPEIVLTVRGPGRILGRLVDAHGEPAAGVELTAALVSGTDERGVPPGGLGSDAGIQLEGGGRIRANCTTGADGAFDLRGLRLERYRLITGPWIPDAQHTQLAPQGILANGAPVEFVHSRPHLVVRCVDASGAPVAARCAPDPRDPYRSGWGWPQDVCIGVESIEPGRAPRGVTVPDGPCVYEIGAGRSYRVTQIGGPFGSANARIDVPADAARIEVVLTCAPSACGWLAIELLDDAGERIEGGWAARVEDPRSDALVLTAVGEVACEKIPLALPAGRYRVVVDGRESLGIGRHTLANSRAVGRIETVVDVVAGATTRVRARSREGARLHVRLVRADACGAGAEPSPQALERGRREGRFASTIPSASRLRFATLHLRQGERAAIPVRFASSAGPSEHGPPKPLPLLALGEEGVSEPLPTGTFVLEAVHPDGRVARAQVELVEGRTTVVALTFE